MTASRKTLAVCFAAIALFSASPVSAQSIDLLRYGAGLGPYETDGYDDDLAAAPPPPQPRAAPQKAARAQKGVCSRRQWDALKGWVNVAAPCR